MGQVTTHEAAMLQDEARSGKQRSNNLMLDLTPAAERSKAFWFGSSHGLSTDNIGGQPDSPVYRSGIDINFLRTHDL